MKLNIKTLIIGSIVISFVGAVLYPGIGDNPTVQNSITFIGILFGIIIGFFIADLYTRYLSIRQNAAADSACLSTFYFFATILAKETGDKEWLNRVEDRINNYVHTFMPLPWEEYGKTEDAFTELGKSLYEIEYKTDKANETFSNILALYSQHSTARESLVTFGRDRLSWGEWLTILFLGILLLLSLFYIKDDSLISILFTGSISSAILILFIVVRDLNNLNFGENSISVEPYERVLDAIGKPRYYGGKRGKKDSHATM